MEGEVVGGERAQNLFVFQTGREFNFAKLHRLKPAGRIQFVPEPEKADRLHGFQNMNLRDQQLFDLDDAAQRLGGFGRAIFFHQNDRCVNLVQDLFEPEFVSLVHGDEKQFIMLGRRGQT